MSTINTKIQLRRDTAANWITYNPILAEGEPGVEIDTNYVKIGDGINNWNNLPYINKTTEFKSYNVGPIEDKALWLRVAKLNLTSMGSASGTFIINYKTTFTDLETTETKTYFLGSAKFDLGASTTVLGGKQRYSLEVTPIFSSLIPVKWASNGTNTPDELEDEFDYEMLLTSVGSGSGLTIYGISHVRLIADPDDVDEVYLEIFFNNSTLRDEKIFEIELSNNKNIVLLDEITQGSIFTDIFEHKIALNEGDTFYKNSATLTYSSPVSNLVVDDNTMILFKDSTNNYYRFGWVDNSFVKESMYPASGGGMASGEILEIYHRDSLEDGKYIILDWVPCDIAEVLSLEGDTSGFAIILKDYYLETKTLEDTPVGQITLEQFFGELYHDLTNLETGVTTYDAEESNT